MAEKRMFAKSVIDSDNFIDMPLTTQALYFHLGMRADDDGFVDSPRKVQRAIGCSDDDMKLLLAKGFVIAFNSGIIVIRHWKLHNYIQKDRYKETVYLEEKAQLRLEENRVYSVLNEAETTPLYTNCIQDVDKMDTQNRIDKNILDKSSNHMSTDVDGEPKKQVDYKQTIDVFNRICKSLPKVQAVTDKRKKAIKAAQQTVDEFGGWEKLFETVEQSDFLSGRSGAWSGCCFDWVLKPSNLTKIIEGNYLNSRNTKKEKGKYDELRVGTYL